MLLLPQGMQQALWKVAPCSHTSKNHTVSAPRLSALPQTVGACQGSLTNVSGLGRCTVLICCSSSSSTSGVSTHSNHKPAGRKSKAPSNLEGMSSINSAPKAAAAVALPDPSKPSSSSPVVAAAAAAATSVTATIPSSNAAVVGNTVLKNPPLGFANNIVPAGPLGVQPSLPRNPQDYSSDEELDDDEDREGLATSQACFGSSMAPGTGRSHAYRCLVLDSRYLPVNVVSWYRAVVMQLAGKADVLDYHPGGFAYSAYQAHPLPAVLRVRTFVDVYEFAGRLTLTRKNIMMRDHHQCQYCGSSRELTLDHVIPVCRGGVNSWSNLVTACMSCNQKKGNKSLQQMGWRLPVAPREPTPQEVGILAGISKNDMDQPPLPWAPYLAPYRSMLEKAQRRSAIAAAELRQAVDELSAVEMHGPDDVLVTVHAAGPKSKQAQAMKAAAVAPAAAASSSSSSSGKGIMSTRGGKRMRT